MSRAGGVEFFKKISEIDLVKFEASNEFITQNLVLSFKKFFLFKIILF
jgi:hypothetical protein